MALTGDFLFGTELPLAYSVFFISLVTSDLFDRETVATQGAQYCALKLSLHLREKKNHVKKNNALISEIT